MPRQAQSSRHTAPLAWIRKIGSELQTNDEIPLFGNSHPFDFDRFSSLIASRFGVQDFAIAAREQEWLKKADVKKGLGTKLLVLSIAVSPLEEPVLWIMSRADIAKITSWLLNGKSRTRALSSEILQEGFYRYLILEALDALQSAEPFNGFTLQIVEEAEEIEGDAFCIDVEISIDAKSCWGRIAIPADFRKSWVRHFASLPSEYVSTETARSTDLVIGIHTGSVSLEQSEWKKLKEGDFVLLDRGGYDPRKGTGAATLVLGSLPLFNVKIKQNKIELLNYAPYHEENRENTMEQKAPPNGSPPPNPAPHAHKLEAAEEEVAAIKEIPLFVTVEIARLKITLDQLMHLTPGNMLELPIHPEQGVSLTVNGQKVGRAELVYLGEALGLRLLEIGS